MRQHLEQLDLPEGGDWKLNAPISTRRYHCFPRKEKVTDPILLIVQKNLLQRHELTISL